MSIASPYLALMAALRWMAVLVSAVLLVSLYREGNLGGPSLAVHVSWFAAAVGLQFLGPSAMYSAAGLLLQAVLAVYLIIRWKMSSF